MLSVGISSWIAALNNQDLGLCKEVEYDAEAYEVGSGCGKGPISPSRLRRKISRDSGAVLWERGGLAAKERALKERCNGDCGSHPRICHYEARMCSAPNEISKSPEFARDDLKLSCLKNNDLDHSRRHGRRSRPLC